MKSISNIYKFFKTVSNHTGIKSSTYIGFLRRPVEVISVTFASIFLFAACSEDLDVSEGIIYNDRAEFLSINFIMPEAERIITRASNDNNNERHINDLTLLLFNSNDKNSTVLYREDLDIESISNINQVSNETNSFTYNLNFSKADGNILYYAIANASSLIKDFTSGSGKKISDLESIISSSGYQNDNAFLMSGSVLESGVKVTIPLIRSASKITVKDENSNDNFELTDVGFSMKTANECYLTAGSVSSTNKLIENYESRIVGNKITGSDGSVRYDAYANPTVTYKETGTVKKFLTYLVIKGKYEGTEYYYAVPLFDMKSKTYFHIEPNHWYDVRISEVSRAGYTTEDEAIKNPITEYVSYSIHDHVADVFSMVSDGIHELGAPLSIELQKTGTVDNNVTTEFTIRCYSANGEEFNLIDLEASVTDGSDWIEILSEPAPIVKDQEPDGEECDNPGKLITFTAKVKNPEKLYTDKEGVITIKWKELERTIPVHYTSDFNPEAAISVKLTIKGDDDIYYIGDYGPFIRGTGKPGIRRYTEGSTDHPKLWGISSGETGTELNDMLADGKLRAQGFHFPMPYGTGDPWEYEYDVDLEGSCIEGNIVSRITATVTGSQFAGVVWTPTEGTTKGRLTFPDSGNNYNYSVGSIKFTIYYKNSENESQELAQKSEVSFSLYHTGFFHWEGNEDSDYKYVPEDEIGYYYYEVVELGEGNYWLDRNIGAKSNDMFVDKKVSVEDSNIGKEEAVGRYYTVADIQGDYENPKFDNFHNYICPPGYRIPTSSEWNDVRLSPDFITENVSSGDVTYVSAFFQTIAAGNVYFPKARYYQDAGSYYETGGTTENKVKFKTLEDVNSGDASAGYYWTLTTAPGMEKEHMGKWLRALYINGASTTYMNGSIIDYKMPVRCKRKTPIITENNYVSFNVHNVTHVYIFNQEGGAPLYSFPGKAVSSNVSSAQWQYFYCTTSADLSTLRVIFTHVDASGKVQIFSKDGNSFTDTRKLNEIIGNSEYSWKLEDVLKQSIDFCEVGEGRDNNVLENRPDDCGQELTGGGSASENSFNLNDELIFVWPKTINGEDYPNFFAWCSRDTGGNYIIAEREDWDNGVSHSGEIENMYKYSWTLGETIKYFTARVCRNGNQINFEISFNNSTNTFEIKHQSNLTTGGTITKTEKSGGGFIWTIQLYDFDGKDSGETEPDEPYEPQENRFNIGDQVTLHWKNEYANENHNYIIAWEGDKFQTLITDDPGYESWGGWFGRQANIDGDGNVSFTIDYFKYNTQHLSIIVLDRSKASEAEQNNTQLRFDIYYQENSFVLENHQDWQVNAPDLNSEYPLNIGQVNKHEFDGEKYIWDITLFE